MKLSVIIPVYNVENYIKECLLSVLNQTFQDMEIIVVDDGSTDNSFQIIEKIALNNSKIILIHQENLGLPAARNAGLKLAKSKYISFIDSDDVIDLRMYEIMIDDLEKNNSQMSVCGINRFDKNTKYVCNIFPNTTIEYKEDNVYDFYKYVISSSCNKIYLKSIIEQYNIFFESKNIVAQEDFFFLFKYISHIYKISFVSGIFYNYRIRKSSITNCKIDSKILEKNLNFISLIQKYNISLEKPRNIESFLLFIKYELLKTTFNNLNPKHINLNLLKSYLNKIENLNEVIVFNYKYYTMTKSFRNFYESLIILFLKLHLNFLYCFFEKIRISRLYYYKKRKIAFYE